MFGRLVGSMGAWLYGGMTIWLRGYMAAWRYGGIAASWLGVGSLCLYLAPSS